MKTIRDSGFNYPDGFHYTSSCISSVACDCFNTLSTSFLGVTYFILDLAITVSRISSTLVGLYNGSMIILKSLSGLSILTMAYLYLMLANPLLQRMKTHDPTIGSTRRWFATHDRNHLVRTYLHLL